MYEFKCETSKDMDGIPMQMKEKSGWKYGVISSMR